MGRGGVRKERGFLDQHSQECLDRRAGEEGSFLLDVSVATNQGTAGVD